MQTNEFIRYIVAMQGTPVPMQRINLDVHPSQYAHEEDRVQSVKTKLMWTFKDGQYYIAIVDPEALYHITHRPMFLSQTMSFRALQWAYADLEDLVLQGLLSCDHSTHADCTPENHRLPGSMSNNFVYLIHFGEIRDYYIRWLRRRYLMVLTGLGRARKTATGGAASSPLQRLVRHPLYDKHIWRLILTYAWPVMIKHKTTQRLRNPAIKRPARCLDVDLTCTEEPNDAAYTVV